MKMDEASDHTKSEIMQDYLSSKGKMMTDHKLWIKPFEFKFTPEHSIEKNNMTCML